MFPLTKTWPKIISTILLLVVAGCVDTKEKTTTPILLSTQPIATVTARIKPTSTNVSSPVPPTVTTIIDESTLEPTLMPTETALTLINLMHTNGGCDLPCVLSVTVGKTSYAEGKRFFEQMGWYPWEQTRQSGKSFEAYASYDDSSLRTAASFLEKNGTIENMHLSISGWEFFQYIDYYSIVSIFAQAGKPTNIWVSLPPDLKELKFSSTTFDLFLYYQEKNMLFQYTGVAHLQGDSYLICPAHPWAGTSIEESNKGNISLYVGSSSKMKTPKELTLPFGFNAETFIGENYRIETMLEMTIDDFYQDLLTRKVSACYEIPKSVWP